MIDPHSIRTSDLGVIGGGIAGAAVAREASLRGLSVELFEKDTLGSGTSSKSSKLIHGGLRYLESSWRAARGGRLGEALAHFRFVFVCLRESRRLERAAPQLVRPIALVMPVYRDGGYSLAATLLAAWVYYLLGLLSGGARAPSYLSGAERVLERLPGLRRDGLAGGIVVWDRWTDDRKLVEATARSAQECGARLFEHTRVTGWRRLDDRTYEVRAEGPSGQSVHRCKALVNASGPWIDRLRRSSGAGPQAPLLAPVAGSHICVPRFTPDSALLRAADGRVFFVINLGETARVGTTERVHDDPDHVEATPGEVEYLLGALERYFPEKRFDASSILSKDAGVRPLAKPSAEQDAHDIPREHLLHKDADGVLHLVGVKLTDHRRAAEETVRVAAELSGAASRLSRTSTRDIPLVP